MSKIYISLTIALLMVFSCSSRDVIEKTKIQAVEETKKELKEVKDSVIKSAEGELTQLYTEQLSGVSDTLKVVISSAEKSISEKVNNEITQKASGYENKIKTSENYGIAGIAIGIVGLLVGLTGIYFSNKKRIKELSVDAVSDNDNIKHFVESLIEKKLKEVKNQLSSNQHYLTENDVKEIVSESIVGMVKPEADSSAQKPAKHVQRFLYASNTISDNLLSVTTSYKSGESVYRITPDIEGNTGTIDLCQEDDAKKRILKYKKKLLSSFVCDVQENSMSPTEIDVIRQGKVENQDESHWKVISKIDVVLR